jgi:hypothetical protein
MAPSRLQKGRTTPPYWSWLLHRCRDDLVALESAGTPRSGWTQAFLTRTGAHTLVEAAELRAAEVLESSNAITRDSPPPVRLTRIAQLLGVRLEFVVEKDNSPREHIPGTESPDFPRSLRGQIAPDGRGGWILRAGSRRSTVTRQTVAHELGHVLLFQRDNGIDLRVWEKAQWSALEETLVNYIARLLLAPPVLIPPTSNTENWASYVVNGLATPFDIPHRIAAVRCLDETKIGSPSLRAFVMWRQYHPFNDLHIQSCFRDWPRVAGELREVGRRLRDEFPYCSFARALLIWQRLLGSSSWLSSLPDLQFSVREQRLLELLSEQVVVRDGGKLGECIDRFTDPHSRLSFRPHWVVWKGRPAGTFVPLNRGKPRQDSIVAELAEQPATIGLIKRESVQLGDLSGHFRVHGFAHGDAASGTRFVLTALEDSDATLAGA